MSFYSDPKSLGIISFFRCVPESLGTSISPDYPCPSPEMRSPSTATRRRPRLWYFQRANFRRAGRSNLATIDGRIRRSDFRTEVWGTLVFLWRDRGIVEVKLWAPHKYPYNKLNYLTQILSTTLFSIASIHIIQTCGLSEQESLPLMASCPVS